MYICIHVYMYVYMYICTYVYAYMYIIYSFICTSGCMYHRRVGTGRATTTDVCARATTTDVCITGGWVLEGLQLLV
jgi:hypothetical protein